MVSLEVIILLFLKLKRKVFFLVDSYMGNLFKLCGIKF